MGKCQRVRSVREIDKEVKLVSQFLPLAGS
jgi:hypothetical protein